MTCTARDLDGLVALVAAVPTVGPPEAHRDDPATTTDRATPTIHVRLRFGGGGGGGADAPAVARRLGCR